ncbi:MAG: xanthine dehydrogenase family protein molybdopterin-binding subunit [Acidimicrobiia bacterium]
MPGSILGHPVLRTEDPKILLGDARYVDDLDQPGALHAVFVRSTVAHARLEGIDTEEAAGMPGVVGVFTAADLALAPIAPMAMVPEAMSRPALAGDVVRFVGDAVAVVVAETRAAAVDAAGEVIVDYDPLPAVVDPTTAADEDSPVLFPDHGTNVALVLDFGRHPDVFDGADVVVSGRFLNQRLAPVPLEVNGALAVPDDAGGSPGITLWVSNQHPVGVRDPLVQALGLPADRVRVVCPAVGGGFGAKIGMAPEHLVLATLALRLGRAVRYVETRSESMTVMTHGRGHVHDVELGARSDGTLVGLRVEVIADCGAYPALATILPMFTHQMACGVYRVPKVDFKATSVTTNTTPMAAYRGAGRPEATAFIERAMDMLAAELGIDPVELRRRNLIPPDAFPHTTASGGAYDSGDYGAALDMVLRMAGYEELRAEQAKRRAAGDPLALGIGVSTYVEVTGAIPVAEYASVEVHADGTVTAVTGTVPHGQGHETAFAQIVSATLGVPLEAVKVVHSDTSAVADSGGTFGSRSLQFGGSSVLRSAEVVLEQAKARAAELLEAASGDIVLTADGRVGVAGSPAQALSWAELAQAGDEPLAASERWGQFANTYPFGAHVAVVEVDTDTGSVSLQRIVAVDDCGRILNPLLVTGQVHGGLAQGIAQALFEEFTYDEDGMPLTSTLADYLFPSAAEFPSFETAHTETPTPHNPLGAKGIGESGTIGSTPAVQSAVVDALAHLGVRHIDMPATPERVWRAIQDAQNA